MPRWNPSLHPRDGNGRFRPKLSQSVRLSPISVSYNAGVRVPIVPGRANLYVGALVRVERAGGNQFLKKQTDRFVNAVAGRFGDADGRSAVAQVLKGNEIKRGGLRIVGPRNVINTPSFRVSSTPASRAAPEVRAARGRTRTRSARVPRSGVGTATVRTLPASPRVRPSRRNNARAISGGRVRR